LYGKAFPISATTNDYQEAIGGCDEGTVYACGIVGGGAQADLTFNPGKPGGETATATQCLIHQAGGQDTLDTATNPFPFQIEAGPGNPMVIGGGLPANSIISSSSSIVTVPIYDDTQAPGSASDQRQPSTGYNCGIFAGVYQSYRRKRQSECDRAKRCRLQQHSYNVNSHGLRIVSRARAPYHTAIVLRNTQVA
jgi:hypothetical protein